MALEYSSESSAVRFSASNRKTAEFPGLPESHCRALELSAINPCSDRIGFRFTWGTTVSRLNVKFMPWSDVHEQNGHTFNSLEIGGGTVQIAV